MLLFPVPALAESEAVDFLNPCIQKLNTRTTPASSFRIDALYEGSDGITYAYVIAIPDEGVSWPAVVSGNSTGCEINARDPMGDLVDLTAKLPKEASENLRLRIQEAIERSAQERR
ncbi:hypothetical protein HRE53_30530 (plasmid) [Acaryochloris sp. 'Moss Beach']|uniref:hypothetical protein n=1 Tax=Acaryochloris sp. 'Moss Beach' TaxID=2740837 RepID=UPI001F1A325A|nr:hypothetical protein [Acaryochloris sp. 'Moss Beach']UJB72928.1 hypothetical protein HRE53_30530 [Acaryochloris sp. 'Moss Beach']